ncbi:diguanylate cyclase domain-containing protein [Roseibium sp.]|uniref:diguanylate cyclase domain-containing protein n=1 Tax=Roseibium sp. TaxID=1936156 RepID=UPI003B50C14F
MSEFRRRYSDKAPKLARQHISRLAFALAGLLIAVTSVSLLFVGFVATRASTQQTIANEERLFRSVVADQQITLVREQIGVASSDVSVNRLVKAFDPAFARETFDTLWTNYRHDKVILISGNRQVMAESFQDYTHIVTRPLAETPELESIVDELTTKYMLNRVRVPGGFGHRSLQDLDASAFAMTGFVRIDGKPALYGAMPVIPDRYEATLPDGAPMILLSALFIADPLLKKLNAQPAFRSFTFEETIPSPLEGPSHLISDLSQSPIGVFRWKSESATASIWPTIIPVIAILSVALGVLAFGIAWRIGRLTTSLQASEQQNRYLALHDTLSGLGNRLLFNRVLDSSAKDLPDKRFAVLHCDLDRFKAVNDTFGHAAGDAVIKTIAERLKAGVGRQGLVCRIGGDEFMIIYRNETTRSHLKTLCDTLIASARETVVLDDGRQTEVGLSIGIARAPEDGSRPEELVGFSDAALYHSKALGRSRFSFFAETPAADGAWAAELAEDQTTRPEEKKKAHG